MTGIAAFSSTSRTAMVEYLSSVARVFDQLAAVPSKSAKLEGPSASFEHQLKWATIHLREAVLALRRLGWDEPGRAVSMALDPLTPTGVADILVRMAFPLDRLGARVDVVEELHRLSGGDPLLVRLYVENLWARGEAASRLEPEDLSHIKPGLDGFFSRWWDDQRQLWGDEAPLRAPALQVLLNLFRLKAILLFWRTGQCICT